MRRSLLKLDLSAVVQHGADPSDSSPGLAVDGRSSFSAQYELGPLLGSGTLAVVKRAVRRVDSQQFAVKCVATDDDEVRQFVRDEYEVIRSLQHPSIVEAEALLADGYRLFLVMELCEDGDLQAYVGQNGPFDEGSALGLFRQLLEAVSYLHQRRVVHRDLKPENCLLRRRAAVLKVTDFNSAKVVGQGAGSSAMLTERGARAFTAPEVLLGRIWNERVDIWSAGLCLHFMLCARLPFDSEAPEVRDTFAAGKLPDFQWTFFSDPMQNLMRQCLTIHMLMRPPAMKLLLHPLFGQPHEEPAGWWWLNRLARQICCSATRVGRRSAPLAMSMTSDELANRYKTARSDAAECEGGLPRAASLPTSRSRTPPWTAVGSVWVCCAGGRYQRSPAWALWGRPQRSVSVPAAVEGRARARHLPEEAAPVAEAAPAA